MSWLNLNQSLSSLKGQITNFAAEVLSEGVVPNPSINSSGTDSTVNEVEEKPQPAVLESLPRNNEIAEQEVSWYWDPPASTDHQQNTEWNYKQQIQELQNEISSMKEKEGELRPDMDEELIRLKDENRTLTANLEDLDNQHQLAMERLLTLKTELQKNFEVLKQEHEDIKNSNADYAKQVQHLIHTIKERDDEIEELKTCKPEYDTLHHKYMNLEKVHTMLRENAEKFQEENQELHEEVFKLQEQVTKLEHEIEINAKHSELSDMVPREGYEQLQMELNDLKSRPNSNIDHFDEINIDDNAKSVIENLKREIQELKHKLLHKEESDDVLGHQVIADKITQLYKKYVNFELPVDYIGEIPSTDDSIIYKLEMVFKTVNHFKREIDTLNHKLSEKHHDINHLQTQIDDLTTENDFLTTDIQHFEVELNEMKKNNDFLISEIAALKNTSKLDPIIETHEDNLAKLETELADSNRINKTFETEINRIELELKEVRAEKTVLQESLNDLRQKYSTMLSELESFKTHYKAVEDLEHSVTSGSTAKLEKAFSKIEDLKKNLISANSKNEQLSIDIHILENEKVLREKEVDDLQHKLKEMTSTHKEVESLNVSLSNRLKELENELNEGISYKKVFEHEKLLLEQKISALQSEMSKSNNSNHTLAEVQKNSTERLELSNKLSDTIKENETLRSAAEVLKDKVLHLEQAFNELLKENNSLKNSLKDETKHELLQKTADELKAQIIEQKNSLNELLGVKDENKKLLDKKMSLEAELISTDTKISQLSQDFEKIILELNEKDNIIDNLNSTIAKNNITLSAYSNDVNDLSKSIELKNDEIQRLIATLNDTTEKLNNETENSDQNIDELHKLQIEKEEADAQILILSEDLISKNFEISSLTSKLQESENVCASYEKSSIDKEKEIEALKKRIIEVTEELNHLKNVSHDNNEYAKLKLEKKAFEKDLLDLKASLATNESELTELITKCDHLDNVCLEYKTALDNVTREKTELINLVNLKHNESIQYHNEIQRLNHVLLEQTNEFKRVINEKNDVLASKIVDCVNCDNLRTNLNEKNEVIKKLNNSVQDRDKLEAELKNYTERVNSLTERCEHLEKNLTMQLETVERLMAEKVELSNQEDLSSKELERLRRHLVETEENYTQELMASEQKLTECQTRLHQIEERAKQNSTVYTSNSIRANQEVETLRNQIKLLEKQREDVQAKLSEAEDARIRSEAAATNLQVVLEQFQSDKDKDISSATEKLRNKMDDLSRENQALHDEISRLQAKLDESMAGIQAATRLGDQVESKTAQINDLKEQLRAVQASITAAEERYYNAISNQQDKVDKNLIKNLVLNYILTAAQNAQNKTQVLRILSTVLDFNQQECEKLGLVRSANATDSLAAEFVKFLQNESRPRPALPNMMNIADNTSRSATPTSRKSSVLGPQPEVTHKRSPSTGSNNLLFQNIETMETSSQRSADSREPRIVGLDTGVNQTRNTEGAILKYVLKDM